MLALFCLGCSEDAAVQSPSTKKSALATDQQQERLLGIGVAPSSQDYGEALDDAIAAGLEVFEVPQQWKEIENKENIALLKLFNTIFSTREIPVVLTLNPLDTFNNQIPDDLKGMRFDDPRFLRRYKTFADRALEILSDVELVSLAVGNEVNILLGDDADLWQQYTAFFVRAKEHLKQARPDVPVGVKFTYHAFQEHRDRVDRIIAASDLVMITYYPIEDGVAIAPDAVRSELEQLVAAYPNKSIQLNEVGYPSSSELQGSPTKQAEFVSQVFATWDANPQIELVTFVWLNDIAPAAARKLKQTYGSSTPIFVEALSTLGLRTHDGKPKPAFLRLKQEAQARGFGGSE